jgi:predicted nucleic acid-binding protein
MEKEEDVGGKVRMSLVIDANLVVALAIPLPYSEAARNKLVSWKAADEQIFTPMLCEYEVTSALRKAVNVGLLDSEQGMLALRNIHTLNVHSIAPNIELHQQALRWAERLKQSKAYDAQYLALAEELRSVLWTGDLRLVNGARQAGADWVHWVGED